MASKKSSGFSIEKLVLFVFIGGLVGFFIGRATAPKLPEKEQTAVNKTVAAADITLAAGDTGKKLDAISSPAKGPEDALVVIHEVSEFQ
jgi:hypothetical protein